MAAAPSSKVRNGLQQNGSMSETLTDQILLQVMTARMKIQTAQHGPLLANAKRILFTWSGLLMVLGIVGKAAKCVIRYRFQYLYLLSLVCVFVLISPLSYGHLVNAVVCNLSCWGCGKKIYKVYVFIQRL